MLPSDLFPSVGFRQMLRRQLLTRFSRPPYAPVMGKRHVPLQSKQAICLTAA